MWGQISGEGGHCELFQSLTFQVNLITPSTRPLVRKFMLENFYAIAPVPMRLGLYNDGKVSKQNYLYNFVFKTIPSDLSMS